MEAHIREFLEETLTQLESARKDGGEAQMDFNTGVQVRLFREVLDGPRELWYTAIIAAPSGPQSFASKDFREFCEWISDPESDFHTDPAYIKAWFNVKIHGEFKDYYAIEMPRKFYWDFLTA